MKKQRYWGLATLAILWVFISIIIGAATGQTGTSAITLLWFLVAIYAVSGSISGIFKTAKFVLILQATVGSFVFLWLLSDTSAQRTLGTPTEFAIGIGVSMAAWGVLYLWAKDKNSAHGDKDISPKMDKYSQQHTGNFKTQKTESTVASATKPLSKFEKSNLSGFKDPSSSEPSQGDTQLFADTPETNDKIVNEDHNLSAFYHQKPSKKHLEEIEILLDYDNAVRAMIEEVSGLPLEVKQSILLGVLNNPHKNIIDIRNATILQALGIPDIEWNNDIEFVVSSFKTADPENVAQFFKVFPVLSRRMSIREIRNKVISIPESNFYVESASGSIIQITQRGDDVYEFTSFLNQKRVTLHSLEAVFDYLGTPKKLRQKRKSL